MALPTTEDFIFSKKCLRDDALFDSDSDSGFEDECEALTEWKSKKHFFPRIIITSVKSEGVLGTSFIDWIANEGAFSRVLEIKGGRSTTTDLHTLARRHPYRRRDPYGVFSKKLLKVPPYIKPEFLESESENTKEFIPSDELVKYLIDSQRERFEELKAMASDSEEYLPEGDVNVDDEDIRRDLVNKIEDLLVMIGRHVIRVGESRYCLTEDGRFSRKIYSMLFDELYLSAYDAGDFLKRLYEELVPVASLGGYEGDWGKLVLCNEELCIEVSEISSEDKPEKRIRQSKIIKLGKD